MKFVESVFHPTILWYYSNRVKITIWSTAGIKLGKFGQANIAFCSGKQQAFKEVT